MSLRMLGLVFVCCAAVGAQSEATRLNNEGAAAFAAKDFLLAGRYFHAALEQSGNDAALRYSIMRNLAAWDKQMGRFEEAEGRYAQIRLQRRKAGDRTGEALALNSMGEMKRRRGDQSGAVKAFQEASRILERTTAEKDLAAVWNNLGVALAETGQWETGLELLRRSHSIRRCVLGPAHPDTTLVNRNIASIEKDRIEQHKVSVSALRANPVW